MIAILERLKIFSSLVSFYQPLLRLPAVLLLFPHWHSPTFLPLQIQHLLGIVCLTLSLLDVYWVVRIEMLHLYCHQLSFNVSFGIKMQETKVKSEHPKSRPDVNPDTGNTGKSNNQNRNQQLKKTTNKFFRRTEAICGHLFDSPLFIQADQYPKTLKKIFKYVSTNFKSNVRKLIETLKILVLNMPDTPMPHTNENRTEVAVTKTEREIWKEHNKI